MFRHLLVYARKPCMEKLVWCLRTPFSSNPRVRGRTYWHHHRRQRARDPGTFRTNVQIQVRRHREPLNHQTHFVSSVEATQPDLVSLALLLCVTVG